MAKVPLKPLAELFRARVLFMLRREGFSHCPYFTERQVTQVANIPERLW
jgi:hypothetical protein